MKRIILFVVLFLSVRMQSSAQELIDLYDRKEYKYAEGKVLYYRILYPKNFDHKKKYPLVLFLHGSGEKGNDNHKQLVHGGMFFLTDSIRDKYPAIIVFPQCPEDFSWNSVVKTPGNGPAGFINTYASEGPWPLLAANELVKELAKTENVDNSRIYISGLSMGGYGTFESVYRFPNLYAAAMPICGGADSSKYDQRVLGTSFWIFHGDSDPAVNVDNSRRMVAKLKSLHADVKYTEYPNVGHNSWDNVFVEPNYITWMFEHKRRTVRP
jgi:predicted peptidase